MAHSSAQSYSDGQHTAISQYRSEMQNALRTDISYSEAILLWILSGAAESYRNAYYKNIAV